MSITILVVIGILMLGGGIAALYIKDTVSAIIAAGSVSLLASIIYLLVGAPDVAMTEAAIGSALTTVVFLFAWSRIKDASKKKKETETDTNSSQEVEK